MKLPQFDASENKLSLVGGFGKNFKGISMYCHIGWAPANLVVGDIIHVWVQQDYVQNVEIVEAEDNMLLIKAKVSKTI